METSSITRRYCYQLRTRPVGPASTPLGSGRQFHARNLADYSFGCAGQDYGHVSYDAPLQTILIEEYCLIPHNELIEINGQLYRECHLCHTLYHTASRLQSGAVQLHSSYSGSDETSDTEVSYPDFVHQREKGQWEALG